MGGRGREGVGREGGRGERKGGDSKKGREWDKKEGEEREVKGGVEEVKIYIQDGRIHRSEMDIQSVCMVVSASPLTKAPFTKLNSYS